MKPPTSVKLRLPSSKTSSPAKTSDLQSLVRLDILIAGQMIDSLSQIVHRDEAAHLGQATVTKLKDLIPRQNFRSAKPRPPRHPDCRPNDRLALANRPP